MELEEQEVLLITGLKIANGEMELEVTKMKEITLNIDGKEIKATVSEKELEKLTGKEWPQEGDLFWWLDESGEIRAFKFKDNRVDRLLLAIGSFFRTKEEVENCIRARKLITAIAKRRKQLNGDWALDWRSDGRTWFIKYCCGQLDAEHTYSYSDAKVFGAYKNFESVRVIIDEFHDELLWFFTEYVVSVN